MTAAVDPTGPLVCKALDAAGRCKGGGLGGKMGRAKSPHTSGEARTATHIVDTDKRDMPWAVRQPSHLDPSIKQGRVLAPGRRAVAARGRASPVQARVEHR